MPALPCAKRKNCWANIQPILRSTSVEVKIKIKTDGPFVMIGEKIDPTGRKELAEAL
jgi:cobalamin-dependent methionine synthase I